MWEPGFGVSIPEFIRLFLKRLVRQIPERTKSYIQQGLQVVQIIES